MACSLLWDCGPSISRQTVADETATEIRQVASARELRCAKLRSRQELSLVRSARAVTRSAVPKPSANRP
jgi:hypothetical protein